MAAKLFNRVAALRRSAGLTQSELGIAVGVTPETIGAIENGRQDATLLTALRIAAVLRTPVPNIFREQPFPQLVGSNGGESHPT